MRPEVHFGPRRGGLGYEGRRGVNPTNIPTNADLWRACVLAQHPTLGRFFMSKPRQAKALRKAQLRRMFSGQQDPQPVHDPTLADQPVGSANGLQFVAAQVDPTFRYVVFLAGDGRPYNVAT